MVSARRAARAACSADMQVQTVGQRITIAWNHSRESARAVSDALPLLRTAASVEILAINLKQDSATSPGEDLASALSRHGLKASALVVNAASRSEADELTAALPKHESDLLVAIPACAKWCWAA